MDREGEAPNPVFPKNEELNSPGIMAKTLVSDTRKM